MPTVNEQLLDREIRHGVFINRLSVSVARRMVALLNRTETDIVRQMRELDPTTETGRIRQRRLERMLERIREINEETRKSVKAAQGAELVSAAQHEIAFRDSLIREVAGEAVTVSLDMPSPSRIRAAALSEPFRGVHLRWATQGEHVDEAFRRRLKLVTTEIKLGVVEGESIENIVKRIRGTRAANFKDGVLETSRREAVAIARTAVNSISNKAHQIFVDENPSIYKAWLWVSVLDNRTTAICRARSGKIFPIDGKGTVPGIPASRQGKPARIILTQPPSHVNCRSLKMAITKSFQELGIDAEDAPGLDGNIPDLPTYSEWLRKQPRDFVLDTLGKTKGRAFLDGDLPLDRFVDNATGRELTIEQLRETELGQKAFKKAGLDAA